MPTIPPLVQTVNLTKHYGGARPALLDLNLSIAPGEIFGLLGPNGSGKSTALRLMMGFLQPTSGSASIAGFDCWHDSVEVRKRVAYLPGELRLYESMSGRQILRFLGGLRETQPVANAAALAERLDIDLSRPLIQMSSGMKRKVALMSVLLPKVDLLILDEPTNTLDPTMRDELLDQLRRARDRGQAVLFSSHVLEEVERVCDRVGILQLGRLMHLQDMKQIHTRRVTVQFAKLPEQWPDFIGQPKSQSLDFDYDGPLDTLLAWLSQQSVADIRIKPAGLSAIYHRFHGNPENS
jgi:beta-exotoxin I transport system ATP-binding protein